MAIGDIVFFDQYLVDTQKKIHDLNTDVIKLGFIDSVTTPSATTPDPRWGAGGSTNLSSNEVTPGGNYSAGGPTIANTSLVLSSGLGLFDGDNISIAQDLANPNNARWGIIYNNTATGKNCLGYLDLGGVTDLSAAPLNVNWSASGIASMDQA